MAHAADTLFARMQCVQMTTTAHQKAETHTDGVLSLLLCDILFFQWYIFQPRVRPSSVWVAPRRAVEHCFVFFRHLKLPINNHTNLSFAFSLLALATFDGLHSYVLFNSFQIQPTFRTRYFFKSTYMYQIEKASHLLSKCPVFQHQPLPWERPRGTTPPQ